MLKKVRQFTGDFKPRIREIKKADGTVEWDCLDILDSWREYYEHLY